MDNPFDDQPAPAQDAAGGGGDDFFGAPAEGSMPPPPMDEGFAAGFAPAPEGQQQFDEVQPPSNGGYDFGGGMEQQQYDAPPQQAAGDLGGTDFGESMEQYDAPPMEGMEQQQYNAPPAYSYSAPVMEDPNSPITIWKQQNQASLQAKAEEERQRVAEVRGEARKKVESLEEERLKRIQTAMLNNREKEEVQVQTRDGPRDNVWEGVVSMVEMERDKVPDGRRDTSRFRQMLVKLKHAPPSVVSH